MANGGDLQTTDIVKSFKTSDTKAHAAIEPAPGTIIATFDPNGHYGNHTDGRSHAAIYLGQNASGIQIIDQFIEKRNGKTTIKGGVPDDTMEAWVWLCSRRRRSILRGYLECFRSYSWPSLFERTRPRQRNQ
jgi:hypothetical protein